jgi:intermembrane space import and assembly protein 40
MAHGPCGEQFKEAFSCFIFSEEEPKGINCVEAFKNMQDCFREHPDVYADGEHPPIPSLTLSHLLIPLEIMSDDDDEPATTIPADETAPNGETPGQVGEGAVAEIPALAETHGEHRTEPSPSASH